MNVNIGEITGKWDYSSLPSNVYLGRECFLERRESFERFRSQRNPGLIIGNRVRVLTWTTFNIEPTGLVTVGEGTLLVGATFMGAESISLGARCIVSYNVTLADCDFHPLSIKARRIDAVANSPQGDRSKRPALVTKPIVIGNDVWIGSGAMVLKGVHIGDRATIAPGAVITHDIPQGALVAGNPGVILEKGQE